MADLASLPTATTAEAVEMEIANGRRAFPKAQQLFAGAPLGDTITLPVGWYDSVVHPELGAFALVRDGAGLDDLIGEIVRVRYAVREAFVYVLQSLVLPDDTVELSLTRRAFMALARPSLETITADVVVIQ